MDEKNDAEEIKNEAPSEPKLKSEIWEFFKFAVIAVLIVAPIRLWIAQPFIVSGSSMVPTFENGDYLIIDELSYKLSEPKRGDVIVFRYPKNPSQFFIKRIEGMPGETINGVVLSSGEYYVLGDNRPNSSDSRVWGPVKSELIVGKTLVRLWPISALGFF